jgi:hypothetical protein
VAESGSPDPEGVLRTAAASGATDLMIVNLMLKDGGPKVEDLDPELAGGALGAMAFFYYCSTRPRPAACGGA